MREEYDFKNLTVKRRGILPSLQGQEPEKAKVRITIALEEDLAEYFKNEAEKQGLSYQTQINQTLRQVIQNKPVLNLAETEAIKTILLQDSDFIRQIAHKIGLL